MGVSWLAYRSWVQWEEQWRIRLVKDISWRSIDGSWEKSLELGSWFENE
jgi:hypothetical protein